MELMKRLPVGEDDFKNIITEGLYYVDKTLFAKELLDQNVKVSLFTRPPAFWKNVEFKYAAVLF